MGVWKLVLGVVRALFASRSALLLENLALRQQIVVLSRVRKRPALTNRDRHLSS